jgi:hypothetical protein
MQCKMNLAGEVVEVTFVQLRDTEAQCQKSNRPIWQRVHSWYLALRNPPPSQVLHGNQKRYNAELTKKDRLFWVCLSALLD